MKKLASIVFMFNLFLSVNVNAQTDHDSQKSNTSVQPLEKDYDENESIETALEHAKQKWFKLMHQPRANYFKVQQEFDNYFKNHPLEGSGPKEYGLGWLKKNIFYLDRKGRVQPPPPTNYKRIASGVSVLPPTVTDTMAGDWHMLGPSNVQPAIGGSTGGNNGGYAYCVRIDPTNPNKLFTSFVTGGLWTSADNGNAWRLSDANFPSTVYYDIDVCKSNNTIVYAINSTAVVKSIDGGMSWSATSMNSTNYTGAAYDIAVSPTDPNIVLARWGTNIYRTTDGGTTWTVITSGLNNFSIWDSNLNSEVLDWDNSNNSIVYFTDRGDAQNYVNVYKSTNAGISFSLFKTLTLDPGATGTITGWSKICTATNNPNAVYVFIGSGADSYNHLAVQMYKLDVATGNVLLPRINMVPGFPTGYGSAYVLHHGDIAMDIANENNIVWGSYSQVFAQYSTNNGASFSSSSSQIHADLRSVSMKNGKVIFGTDGSAVVSTDSAKNFTSVSNTISNIELWGFGSAFKSDILAAGCNHGPLMLREYNSPGGWYTLLGADQGNSDFNPLDSVSAYSQSYDSYHVTRTGIKSYTNSSQQIDPGGIYSYFNTMEFHPHLYHTLITHHAGQYPTSVPQATRDIWKNSLIRSDDNGLTVNVVYTFSNQLFREKICMTDTSRIYAVVGLTNNSLMKTVNGGTSWTNITPSTSITGSVTNISDIAVADANPNEIWVTYSGVQNTCQVLHSTDGGTTYTNLTTSILTSNPITKIIFQRGTNGGVYICNTTGVYYRNNSMPDWVKLGNGLPQMELRFMFINYFKGKLMIGTSRGAWDHNLYENSSPRAQISASTVSPSCQSPTVQFRDYSVVSSGGIGASYSWSFPGGTPSTSTLETPMVSYLGATAGGHNVTLTVTDQYGTNTQTLTNFLNYDTSLCCLSLPAGWTRTDIGTASMPGEVCYNRLGNYKITSHAIGLGDPNDNIPFVYKTLVGNGQIIARVKNTSGGIMIRNTLLANSAYVFLNSLNGIYDQYRKTDGGSWDSQNATAFAMPMWLKLERRGKTIISFYSADGITWNLYHTYYLPLNNTVYVGLAISGSEVVSNIDNVSVGTVPVCVNGYSCASLDTIPGKAINFYDYAYMGFPVSAPASNTFTLTGWIKPQGTLGQQSAIMAWDNGYFYLGQANDNQLEYVWNSGSASNTWNSGLFVPADKWSFVAMVIRPDSATLYLNNRMVSNKIPHGSAAIANAFLGNSNPGAGYFLGQMDELSVWKRALSTNEIDSMRNLTREKQANPASSKYDANLVGYFQFNDTASLASYNLIDSSFFVLANGVNKAASTSPVGAGFSAMKKITAAGVYTFGTTGIILRFPGGSNPQGNVWITKLNQLPDQYPHASIIPNGYFIVNNYGANSTFSPTIYVKANTNINVTSANALTPNIFKLFKRLANGEGPTWGNLINSASSAKVGTPGNVTFNPGAITSEGQLFVNGGVQAPLPDSIAGKMLDFTSTGNPVDSLSAIPINSNRFSITMWVKPKGLQKVFSQILSSQAPNTYFGIGFAFPGYTDNLNLVFTSNSINYYQQSNIFLLADQWNHVAFTYTPDSVSIYLNGGTPWTFPKASSLTPLGFPSIDFSKAPVTVNADIHGQSGNYKGQEDEICFYNYPLSQQEIREKMFLTKKPGIENGLVGYYQFNQYDSTTNTLYDAMGNGTASTVNKLNIVPSTAPVAAGTSFRIASVNSGTYNFPGTGISLTFPGPIVPNGEMVVSRLRSQPDSMPSGYTRLSSNYWIISNYGVSPFTQPTQMKFDSINISVADAASPGVLKLLKRNTNEFINNWAGPLCSAQWAYSGVYGSVIYINNCNNTTFGQFLIGTTGGSLLKPNFTADAQKEAVDPFISITPNPVYDNQGLSLQNMDNVEAEVYFYLSDGRFYSKYSIAPNAHMIVHNLPKGALIYRAVNRKGKLKHGIVIVQ